MFSYPTAKDAASAGYAMVTERFALLIAAADDAELPTRLWRAMTAKDAAFEDVLSIIAAIGVGRLPDFALVEVVDIATSAVAVAVRGEASIDLHAPGRSRYTGGGVGTWVEGSAQQVAGITLALPGDALPDALPLGRGVARTTTLRWGTPTGAATSAAPGPETPAAPATDPAPAPASDPVPAALADLDPLETVAVDREALIDVIRRRGTATPPAAAEGVPPTVEDATVLGSRRSRAAADAPPPVRRFVLRLSSGEDLPLDRPLVIGRSPKPAHHPGARIVAVPSPRKEVSGAHLEVRLDDAEAVVRDLDSTNGTVVRAPGAAAVLLRGGADLRAPAGTVVDLGDEVVATFVEVE